MIYLKIEDHTESAVAFIELESKESLKNVTLMPRWIYTIVDTEKDEYTLYEGN